MMINERESRLIYFEEIFLTFSYRGLCNVRHSVNITCYFFKQNTMLTIKEASAGERSSNNSSLRSLEMTS